MLVILTVSRYAQEGLREHDLVMALSPTHVNTWLNSASSVTGSHIGIREEPTGSLAASPRDTTILQYFGDAPMMSMRVFAALTATSRIVGVITQPMRTTD